MDRESQLNALRENPVADIVVIGGGATGLGAALDSVTREYRTVLLEAYDFAKGTSSRSTKLVHGGVRYLRSGQIRMVRESLLERGRLLDNAPHVVHPMRFVIPAYKRGERWYYGAGMRLYDFLAGNLNMERSRVLSRDTALELMPTIRTKDLRGGVLYSDGQFDDARLALSLAETCVNHGGIVLNYCPVVELQSRGGRLHGVTFLDRESGEEIKVEAKVVINATGVFGESVMALDPTQTQSTSRTPKIIPSQGTHLVLDREFLPTDYGIMIPDTDDGRVLFVIPWYGKTLIGTTDNPVEEKLPDPRPLPGEVDYLLEHAGRYLTKTPTRSDVLSVFSGLRPLVGSDDPDAPTSALSREHEIHTSPGGMITVIGGKWTTYRKMGEDVLDLAAQVGRLKKRPSRTAYMPLAGAVPVSNEHDSSTESEPTDSFSTDPLSVFGSERSSIEELQRERPELAQTIHSRLPYTKAHVIHAVRFEAARTVEDVLARRTRALLLDARAASESAPVVASLIWSELHSSESRFREVNDEHQWQASQVAAFQELAQGYQVANTNVGSSS